MHIPTSKTCKHTYSTRCIHTHYSWKTTIESFSDFDAARANIAAARANIDAARANIDAARANIDAARANRRRI